MDTVNGIAMWDSGSAINDGVLSVDLGSGSDIVKAVYDPPHSGLPDEDTITVLPVSGIDTSGPNAWYVNDNDTAGDVYTTTVGSDSNDGLSPSTPKRTLLAVWPYMRRRW